MLKLEGFMRLDDRMWQHTGTLGLWILSPHTKKRLTLQNLLGRALQIWPTHHGDR